MTVLRGIGVWLCFTMSVMAGAAQAQVPPNCAVETVTDPDRQVLSCAFGVIIEMEAAAQLGFGDTPGGAAPQVLDLDRGGVLLEVAPGTLRPQIRTPHAIAAVRGTGYVVDVQDMSTSVFVLHGVVAVSHIGDEGAPVVLRAGDGVDVRVGAPLEVRRWPAGRVADLLARFGR
ncbi:FecR family protein [Roseobacter sp.]|uniref:FecR family protein n=1 Tax=Roseobacter sp. TaxID=1907202 RepID=UPI003297547D